MASIWEKALLILAGNLNSAVSDQCWFRWKRHIIHIFSRSWLLGWSRCKNLYLELCMSCWIKRYVWNGSHSTHRITYQINVGSDGQGIEFAWITCGEGAVIYAVDVDDGIICGPIPWGPIPWGPIIWGPIPWVPIPCEPIPWVPIPWGPIIWGLITCGEGFINAAEVDGGAARKEKVDACAAEKKIV